MAQAITVTGPLEPERIGTTSMHEHLLTRGGEAFAEMFPAVTDRFPQRDGLAEEPLGLETAGALRLDFTAQRANLALDDEELTAAELADFAAAGGEAMLDVTGIGLRSDPLAVRRLAERSGVTVVASTGFYTPPFAEQRYGDWPQARLADLMTSEIAEGMDGTEVRAGHIKCGVTCLGEFEMRVLRAAAAASRETGAAVTVHPGFELGSDGRAVADVLEGAGLPLDRLVLAHSDAFMVPHDLMRLVREPESWNLTLDYHRELLERGITLSIDCFGHEWSVLAARLVVERDWQRLAGLVQLIDEGWGEQLVIGTDTFIPSTTRRGGGYGYVHLLDFVIPALKDVGVDEAVIELITVVNPRRLLTL